MNRKLVRLAITAVLLTVAGGTHVPAAARQGATPATADCAATTPAENEALVARWYDEALNGANLAVLDEILAPGLMHDSAIFPDNPPPADVLEQLFAGFPDLAYTVNDVISGDDKVAVRWTATGTNSGDLFGEPPTGNAATWTGINIFQVECGLITAVWSEIDGAGRAAQLRGDAASGIEAAGTPAAAASPAAICAPLSPVENVAVASRWFTEVYNEQDLGVLDEILADGAGYDAAMIPPTAGPRDVVTSLLASFPDFHYTIDDAFGDDEAVVVRWTGTGTQEGEFLGNAPTGIAATWTGITIFHLACGRITQGWSEISSLGLLEQLGLQP